MSLTAEPSIALAMTVQLRPLARGRAPEGPVSRARCRLVGWDTCSVPADAERLGMWKASRLFWGVRPRLCYFPKEIATPSHFGGGGFFFSVGILTGDVFAVAC